MPTVVVAAAAIGVPNLSSIFMLALPLKLTPLIVLPVANVVAVEALPLSVAVIVPALKLPEE